MSMVIDNSPDLKHQTLALIPHWCVCHYICTTTLEFYAEMCQYNHRHYYLQVNTLLSVSSHFDAGNQRLSCYQRNIAVWIIIVIAFIGKLTKILTI